MKAQKENTYRNYTQNNFTMNLIFTKFSDQFRIYFSKN